MGGVTEIAIFSGSAHPELAREICDHLGMKLRPSHVTRFSNDCLEVQLEETCREHDVFIVQPLVPPTQDHLVELLLMIDAARGASAGRITAVIPHYAYARSDKKDAPRISIGGRLVADLLKTAGADRVLTLSLHAPQVYAFFRIPVDHLHALRELAAHFAHTDVSNTVVVSPDFGNIKPASRFAELLGVPVAAGAKQRLSDDKVVISSVIGDVAGRDIIVIDDEIAGGATIFELLDHMKALGAGPSRVVCTHGLFVGDVLERLQDHPDVTEIVSTNTVPISPAKQVPDLTVISVAPALAEAIRRIHAGESVSALFH